MLRLGKSLINEEVVRKHDMQVLYNTWYEELYKELAVMEIKDQELAEACVEVTRYYAVIMESASRS